MRRQTHDTLTIHRLPDGGYALHLPAGLVADPSALRPLLLRVQVLNGIDLAAPEQDAIRRVRDVVRGYLEAYGPDSWPPMRLREIALLCDELDRLQSATVETLVVLPPSDPAPQPGESYAPATPREPL